MDISTTDLWIDSFFHVIKNAQYRSFKEKIDEHQAVQEIQQMFEKLQMNHQTIWWVGNGGSLAVCSHLSQDCLNRLKIKSFVLNDPALLTCMSNDYGYTNVYRQPLKTLMHPDDLLIAISSSGNSENIINAVDYATKNKIQTIALSAFLDDNELWNKNVNVNIYLPSNVYGHAEIGHELLLHAIIEVMCNQKF